MANQAEVAGVAFGRGIAAVIEVSFGFLWLGWGLSAFPPLPTAVWVVDVSIGVVMIAFAVRAVRRGRRMMKAQGGSRSDYWQTRRKSFGIVTLLEVAGCIVVVVLASLFQRPDWIAVGISLVVGLHFLPLGRTFGVVAYYWVGTVIVVWDILTLTAFKSWNLTASAGIGTGVVLWVAAISIFLRSQRLVSPDHAS